MTGQVIAIQQALGDPITGAAYTHTDPAAELTPGRFCKAIRSRFLFARLATSFAMILLALLMAGTVYAQGALPGQFFYPWKLARENVWRALSPDPIATDLAIAGRRAHELIAIGNHAALHPQALNAYLEIVTRLELEMNGENEVRIRTTLDSLIEELNRSGISIPSLEQNVLPTPEEPTVIPTETPLRLPEIPQVNPALPISIVNPTSPVATAASLSVQEPAPSNPTGSLKIIPTRPEATEILPTIQVPFLLP